MTLRAQFQNNNFSARSTQPLVNMTIARLIWSYLGGPDQAVIEAEGSSGELWALIDLLRAPVTIYDGLTPVWWGYAREITITDGVIESGVSLDNMYTRLRVYYPYIPDGEYYPTITGFTDWAAHARGITDFGYKELTMNGPAMHAAEAVIYRDTQLLAYRDPAGIMNFTQYSPTLRATIRMAGWWSTLDWRYYYSATSGNLDSIAKIALIMAISGQFLAGVNPRGTSGVSTVAASSGLNTGMVEVIDLLKTGDSSGNRIVSLIDAQRRAEISVVTKTPEYYQDRTGALYNAGGYLMSPYFAPVGRYVSLKNGNLGTIGLSKSARTISQFCASAEWTQNNGMILQYADLNQ